MTVQAPWVADLGDGSYRNPVLNADWSDPDVVRVGEDFYLIASSFHRVPGIPVLHSTDLVNWRLITHALPRPEPREAYARPRWGCGVWAPAIRHHGGLLYVFYPDPDHGIYVVTAADAAGPWSRPHLLKAGRGLIDPCPLWADDGSAYLVHGWARSRSGISNRLTMHRMSPQADRLLDDGTVAVDGDALAGCDTLEGPKLYQHGGWYWIFAPAGGVTNGWQSVLRSRDPFGPYEHRVVLEQGDTPVNGPHQGAWVTTASGEDWFLHFSDQGAYGRVVHLQPMRWSDDGWPVIGAAPSAGGVGHPVLTHRKPGTPPAAVQAPASSDDFDGPTAEPRAPGPQAPGPQAPGPQWTWQGTPSPQWWSIPQPGTLRLACRPDPATDLRDLPHVLGQRFPAGAFTVDTTVALTSDAIGARAGLAVVGKTYAWTGLERRPEGIVIVHRVAPAGEAEHDTLPPVPAPDGPVTLTLEVRPGGECVLAASPGPEQAAPFTATPGQWVGASVSLFSTAPGSEHEPAAGHADFTAIRFSPPSGANAPGGERI